MSISDDLMLRYYELLSETSLEEFQKIREAVSSGSVNPMEYKQRLAREIVSRYHEQNLALSAEERFNYVHRRKNVPEKLEEQVIKYSTNEGELSIVKVLRQMGRISSNSEARRLIEQGGVRLDGETINDMNYVISPQNGQVVQIGKRYFRKLKYEKEQI